MQGTDNSNNFNTIYLLFKVLTIHKIWTLYYMQGTDKSIIIGHNYNTIYLLSKVLTIHKI